MGRFPYSFRSRTAKDDASLDRALATNFANAATEDYVDAKVAAVSGGTVSDASTTTKGVSKLSVAPAVATDPIAAGTNDPRMSDARTPTAHTHPISDVTNLQVTLDGKQPLDADLTTIAGLDSGTAAGVMATEATGWVKRTYAQIKTSLALVKGDVGLGSVDNTSDLAKPVSTATQTALDAKAPLASPALTGTPSAPTAASGTNTTQLATTAFVQSSITAGTGIQATIVDAKGDLIVATAADTVARQAVGSNGSVFVADSAQASGVKWQARVMGKAARTSAVTIPHNAWTAVTFTTELTDTASMVDIVGAVSRVTCTVVGPYTLHGLVGWTSNTTGLRGIRFIHRNSAGALQAILGNSVTSENTAFAADMTTTDAVHLSPGDYIELEVYQGSGAGLSTAVASGTYHASLALLLAG